MRIMLVQKNDHANSAGMIQAMLNAGHIVLSAVSHPAGTKSVASTTGVAPTVIPYSRLSLRIWGNAKKRLDLFGVPSLRRLSTTLREFGPDLVLVKDLRTTTFIAVALARLHGARALLLWNKPRFARKWPLRSILATILLPSVKLHMGHYGVIGESIPLGGTLGRSTLSPYPVPIARTSARSRQNSRQDPATRSSDDRVRIVAIGSLTNPVKRMAWVSEAIAHLGRASDVDVTYIGMGDEECEAYRAVRAVEREHSIPAARFLFNLNHSELLDLLPEFDILAHPSEKENFGAVITEAMAAGLAVLCSDRCGARVCFEDRRTGLLFKSPDRADFEEKLALLIDDAQLRTEMGSAAKAWVDALLTPEAWIHRLEQLLPGGSAQRVTSSGAPPG